MQEELDQFERNHILELVLRPKEYSIIVIKWVFHNRLDESKVVGNKACLIFQGYKQEERMDYDETYALVAIMKSMLSFLKAYKDNENGNFKYFRSLKNLVRQFKVIWGLYKDYLNIISFF
jgi:hypothetical protein